VWLQVGVHGLIIDFQDPVLLCKRSATFLPEVAKEQGWSQQECIEALIKKAGGYRYMVHTSQHRS
jgi:AMMECR1 domain-containing protein